MVSVHACLLLGLVAGSQAVSLLRKWQGQSTPEERRPGSVSGLGVHQGKCDCLSFATVYTEFDTKCGSALEGYTETRTVGQLPEVDAQWCKGHSFYRQLDSEACVKVDQKGSLPDQPADFSEGAWCYVNAECTNLHGGQIVNDRVSWKSCQQGQDIFLAELSGREILKISLEFEIDDNMLAQMSYPVVFEPYGNENLQRSLLRAAAGENNKHGQVLCTDSPKKHSKLELCGSGDLYIIEPVDKVWCIQCGLCLVGESGELSDCLICNPAKHAGKTPAPFEESMIEDCEKRGILPPR